MSSIIDRRRVFAALVLAIVFLAVQHYWSRGLGISGTVVNARAHFLDKKFRGEDDVTRAIRTESNVFSRIWTQNAADRTAAAQMGRIIQDYGSFVVVAKDREVKASAYGLDEQAVETTINLPGAKFDPIKERPEGSLRLGPGATSDGSGYYILQFGATATDEWLNSLSDGGVDAIQYVAHNAYLVYGDSEAIARIADHSRVRWIGKYLPQQKLTSFFRKELDSALKGTALSRGLTPIQQTKKRTAIFDVAVFAREDLASVGSELQRSYGKGYLRLTRLQHNFFNIVRLELDLNDVQKVAALESVFSIDSVVPSQNEDSRSAQIIAGNYANPTTLNQTDYNPWVQFGTDGRNVTVSVVDDGVGIPGDGGFYLHGLNTVQGPLRGAPSGALGHGHLNASIIAGSAEPAPPLGPDFFNYGLGVAPAANIVSIPRNRAGYTGDDQTVYDDSVSTPGVNGAHATISNNSWGNGTNDNTYGTMEAQFDGFVRDASLGPTVDPITLIFSAGNSGSFGLTRPKTAKNLIAVGNSEGLRSELAGTSANNMDDLASDSSLGPTADGRIKPDLVAPGTAITGGRSGPDSLSGNIDTFHRWSSGTSHSAAQVSGAAALFASYYGQWTGERLTPSLIKAALINSAVDLNGQGTASGVPNGSEGWGRPNLKNMLISGVNIKYVNETTEFTDTGQQPAIIPGSVQNGSKPVRVTLVWTDPPGTADPALVNDLDLEVTVGGTTYKGNVFANGVSVAGGVADTVNNVESVLLPAGIPTGTGLSVKVKATSLNGDGVLNNGDPTDQRYSLIIFNWSATQAPSFYQLEGRAISSGGRGIGKALVRITDGQGISREIRSNPLGYFVFNNVAGGTYTVSINAKRYTFLPQNVSVTANVTGVVFRAEPGAP